MRDDVADVGAADRQPAASGPSGLPASHTVALPGGGWAVWRWVGLRSAGFPAEEVLRLAVPGCAAAADALAALEDGLLAGGAIAPDSRTGEASLGPFGDETVAAARRRFEQLFSAARHAASEAIRDIAAAPRFREAIAWQNHPLLQSCIAPLLRHAAGRRSSKDRQHEELVAAYLQRYCVKNETIGFFGPVGWARLSDCGGVEVDPGPRLLRTRQVYFEQWAIDRLADRLSRSDQLKPWIPIRPTPAARIDGLKVRPSFRPPVELTEQEMDVFAACDGRRRGVDLAERLCRDKAGPRVSRDRLEAVLDKLQRQRLIARHYELPIDAHPERQLRALLEHVGDGRARRSAIAPLEQLEAGRAAIAAAAGDPDRLHRALLDLDAQFTAATGARPSRAAGEMYWGRTLVYEDCQRDIAVRIGPSTLASLGPPLTLVLASARWLTHRVGQHCRTALAKLFERSARAAGASSIGFVEFYNHGLHLLSKETAFAGMAAELQRRWTEILAPPSAARSVRYRSQTLRARVAEAFAAPAPGWLSACYHSPDLMIAAPNLAAIAAGDCDFVLGELHVGVNTLRGQFLVEQHPDPNDLLRGIEADLPEARLTPITPRRYAQRATRIFPVLTARGQWFVTTTLDSIPPPGAATLAGGSLFVRRLDGDLVIENRDGSLRFDLVQSFAGVMARIVVDSFAIMAPARHTPRVAIDRLIVAREAWRFATFEIDFAGQPPGAERFLAARRWRSRHGMPRWVFVKVAGEAKPVYLDFDSPLAIDVVARQIRSCRMSPVGAAPITVSEMIPHHGQHWLPDGDGKRYSCELRFVAVDRAGALHGSAGERPSGVAAERL